MVRSHARRSGISSVDDLESESVSTVESSSKSHPLVDVTFFGAEGDGSTDDTQAIKDAANHADSLVESTQYNSVYVNTRPTLYFPEGKYDLSGLSAPISTKAAIRGDGAHLIAPNQTTDVLDVSTRQPLTVEGLVFINGRYQLTLSDANIDQGLLRIEDCVFDTPENAAIKSIENQSSMVSVNNCRFTDVKQVWESQGTDWRGTPDSLTFRDNFVSTRDFTTDNPVYDFDSAGRVRLKDNIHVPDTGDKSLIRWIDLRNNMTLALRDNRFGGEKGGMGLARIASGGTVINARGNRFAWANSDFFIQLDSLPDTIDVRGNEFDDFGNYRDQAWLQESGIDLMDQYHAGADAEIYLPTHAAVESELIPGGTLAIYNHYSGEHISTLFHDQRVSTSYTNIATYDPTTLSSTMSQVSTRSNSTFPTDEQKFYSDSGNAGVDLTLGDITSDIPGKGLYTLMLYVDPDGIGNMMHVECDVSPNVTYPVTDSANSNEYQIFPFTFAVDSSAPASTRLENVEFRFPGKTDSDGSFYVGTIELLQGSNPSPTWY